MEYPFFNKFEILRQLKLNNAGIRKSLGQNFLIDPNYVQKIVNEILIYIPQGNTVLEIGPGLGALTFFLTKFYNLEVVEIDKVYAKILNDLLKDKIIIHNVDYLKFLKEHQFINYKYIIGNLPYYITTDIIIETIRHMKVDICIFLVQKEYGEKLLKNNNSISIFLHNFATVKKLFVIPPKVFFPPPKVESMLLKIQLFPKPISDPQILEKILRMSFRQKRKKMINSWQNGEELINIDTLIHLSKKINFNYEKRAEEIPKEQFYELTNKLSMFL